MKRSRKMIVSAAAVFALTLNAAAFAEVNYDEDRNAVSPAEDAVGYSCVLITKAEQICQAIREIRLESAGGPGTSVSIGIAQRADGDCFEDLYRKADAALYITKKEKNRDGFTIYEA